MYYGTIGSESLKNPLILNSLRQVKVIVEYFPSSRISPYWHTYFVEVENNNVIEITESLCREIKYSCFAILWNKKRVFVIFQNKVFQLDIRNAQESEEWKIAKEYGKANGVQEEYLDFSKEFEKFDRFTIK